MARVRNVYVVCSECNGEIDRIEFDADAPSAAVQAVTEALGLDEKAAFDLVKKQNPGAELNSEQKAKYLAEQIVARNVDGRDQETYVCPLGHDAELKVTEDSPTPLVHTSISKGA